MRLTALLLLLLLWPPAPRAQGLPGGGPDRVYRVCWQENRPLAWRDFQAKTSAAHPGESLFTATAYAALELSVAAGDAPAGKHTLEVRAAFDQTRAWVRDSTVDRARTVLAHEQLHFDICELVARKLRFRIAQVDRAGGDVFNRQLDAEVKCLLDELDTTNDLYDQETAYGLRRDQQKKWRADPARTGRAGRVQIHRRDVPGRPLILKGAMVVVQRSKRKSAARSADSRLFSKQPVACFMRTAA